MITDNITREILEFGENPTHILLTREQYNEILSLGGINHRNIPTDINELFGLSVIFSEAPIDKPKILKINQ